MKSDKKIQQDVLDELNWDPAINAAKLGVEVSNGVVHLVGSVDTYSEKWKAERAVLRVIGVRALAVGVEVCLLHLHERTDTDIAEAVKNIIDNSSYLINNRIQLMVEDGWVTLFGEVNWAYQRGVVDDLIKDVNGVRGITNKICTIPEGIFHSMLPEINLVINRTLKTNQHGLTVSVEGASVTLSGSLPSWKDRERVEYLVWGVPGVARVIDHITILA